MSNCRGTVRQTFRGQAGGKKSYSGAFRMEHEAGEMFRAQLRTGPLRETKRKKDGNNSNGRKYSNDRNERRQGKWNEMSEIYRN